MGQNVVRTSPLVSPHVNLAVNPASAGDSVLVAAVSNRKIRVLALALVSSAANTVTFKSSVAGAISGAFSFAANGGMVLPFNEHGWFETVAGEGLLVGLSAASAVGLQIQYVVLPVSV